ncbi:CoA transferase [Pseudooceanicola sp. 216_PA32_1]|uniref:CoA transferase n=1 Tax=Pseudooceanicola pacificus TaxID=2676438 RepID=A0A844W9Y3_9RHOB|nr:CoA transferase [Pseudooceanicola pacificus]MWB77703.1 CoA transferase [Pseudooceanicola pacificus]
MSAPLDGLKVADFSELLPGPFLSMALVELGAEVTKVERPPHGDGLRRASPGLFRLVNRGKGSVALNLKDDAGRAAALDLVSGMDVMIDGFRPGVMDRLGVGYAACRAVNPRLIYIGMYGYGATGPMAGAPGHDLNYLALAGVTALCGRPDGPPEHSFGLPVADLGGALYGLSSVLAAVIQRDRTGEGQFIDLSLTDCLAHWVNTRRAVYDAAGVEDLPGQRRIALVRPAYGVFACADGAVSIAALEDHFWRAVCATLDMGRFDDPAYAAAAARREEAGAINARIADQVARQPLADLLARFEAGDVPASPVLSPAEAAASDHFAARGLIEDSPAGPITPFPVRLNGMRRITAPVPELNASRGASGR